MATFRLVVFAAALLASSAWGADAQRTFATPEDAARALVAAAKAADTDALVAILGADARSILSSGDARIDQRNRERFVSAYEESNKLDEAGDATRVLVVGKEAWPFPIPLVQAAPGWRFDATAGAQEILNRHIGRNELAAIQVIEAYVDAQREYYLRNPQNDKLLQYAQKLVSAEGKRDGLYWPVQAGERPSPLGPLIGGLHATNTATATHDATTSAPYFGYRYRILKAQGPDAPGGAYSYLAQGTMIGGFALIAWPVAYGKSGVMTFIVNHEGVVYEKDLGPDTVAEAQKITEFNPDKSWKRV
ncbi:MAG: DUF2950 domain-containing protein [Sulfurifustaceae bacterium]